MQFYSILITVLLAALSLFKIDCKEKNIAFEGNITMTVFIYTTCKTINLSFCCIFFWHIKYLLFYFTANERHKCGTCQLPGKIKRRMKLSILQFELFCVLLVSFVLCISLSFEKKISSFQADLMSQYSDIVTHVTSEISQQYSRLQQQHNEYVKHINQQIAQLDGFNPHQPPPSHSQSNASSELIFRMSLRVSFQSNLFFLQSSRAHACIIQSWNASHQFA
jgi:sensor histidine kinase YesM